MQGCSQSFSILERRNNTITVKSLFNETQRINPVLSKVASPHFLLWFPSSHYQVGCDHRQSLCPLLLKWSLMKESPGFLARCRRLQKPANKSPRERVILLYNRKYVLLWDALQYSLWVIRTFFLKRNLHPSMAQHHISRRSHSLSMAPLRRMKIPYRP